MRLLNLASSVFFATSLICLYLFLLTCVWSHTPTDGVAWIFPLTHMPWSGTGNRTDVSLVPSLWGTLTQTLYQLSYRGRGRGLIWLKDLKTSIRVSLFDFSFRPWNPFAASPSRTTPTEAETKTWTWRPAANTSFDIHPSEATSETEASSSSRKKIVGLELKKFRDVESWNSWDRTKNLSLDFLTKNVKLKKNLKR